MKWYKNLVLKPVESDKRRKLSGLGDYARDSAAYLELTAEYGITNIIKAGGSRPEAERKG